MKRQAIAKLSKEIDKNLESVRRACKHATLIEAFEVIWFIHATRISSTSVNETRYRNPELAKLFCPPLEDTLKYLLSCILKFGSVDIPDVDSYSPIAKDYLGLLVKQINLINAKYEAKTLIQLSDVEFSIENQRYIKVDFSNLENDSILSAFFNYFLRVERDNLILLGKKKSFRDLLNSFRSEFQFCSDLFEAEFEISLELFIKLIQFILEKIGNYSGCVRGD